MAPQKTEAALELKSEAILGEGPVWDERDNKLWWTDILSGMIICYSPEDQTSRIYHIGECVGALALREKGGLVLALQSGFAFFDPETGDLQKIHDPEADKPANRFNDGKCDPSGRFWAGTMAYVQDDQSRGKGSLYRLNSALTSKKILSDITISNGLAWNTRERKFYFIDTPEREIRSFDYDENTGEISNPSVLRILKPDDGYPDGMTIDEEGYLWVALYFGHKVIRLNPQNGQTVYEITLPVPKATCCTFGGKSLDVLYITTAREHMTEQELKNYPLSGSLFKAKVPFQGLPSDRFLG
ncbi:MAG: SMP-30/gluconolactonase/LRE family protein [Balneolaceae bacterium]